MHIKSAAGVKRKSCAFGVDNSLPVADVVALAAAGQLRARAFGETAIIGSDRLFNGDWSAAARFVSECLLHGHMVVYRDADGVFVGPPVARMVSRSFAEGAWQ